MSDHTRVLLSHSVSPNGHTAVRLRRWGNGPFQVNNIEVKDYLILQVLRPIIFYTHNRFLPILTNQKIAVWKGIAHVFIYGWSFFTPKLGYIVEAEHSSNSRCQTVLSGRSGTVTGKVSFLVRAVPSESSSASLTLWWLPGLRPTGNLCLPHGWS